jgi:hypothetical protein
VINFRGLCGDDAGLAVIVPVEHPHRLVFERRIRPMVDAGGSGRDDLAGVVSPLIQNAFDGVASRWRAGSKHVDQRVPVAELDLPYD